jgi:acetyltransferase
LVNNIRLSAMLRFGELMRLEKRQVRRVAANRDAANDIITRRLSGKDRHFSPEHEAGELLQCYGFPILPQKLVTHEDEIEEAVDHVGWPVAMKICSPDIIHKFDAGGVRLKIKDVDQAKAAYREIIENAKKFKPDAFIKGVLMEKMARSGVEVILGAMRDPRFGPMVMFGLGGTLVEAIRDVSFRLAPMWEISAEKMMKSIRGYRILQGVRGNPPSDIEAVKDCVLRLSQMVSDHPEIAELDINPLIVYPEGQGCVVADSRILLTKV